MVWVRAATSVASPTSLCAHCYIHILTRLTMFLLSVNAANKMLQHAGGLAAAFIKSGGKIIQVRSCCCGSLSLYLRVRTQGVGYGHTG